MKLPTAHFTLLIFCLIPQWLPVRLFAQQAQVVDYEKAKTQLKRERQKSLLMPCNFP